MLTLQRNNQVAGKTGSKVPRARQATYKDVRPAAKIGNAQFKFLNKYGRFPTEKAELEEFLS